MIFNEFVRIQIYTVIYECKWCIRWSHSRYIFLTKLSLCISYPCYSVMWTRLTFSCLPHNIFTRKIFLKHRRNIVDKRFFDWYFSVFFLILSFKKEIGICSTDTQHLLLLWFWIWHNFMVQPRTCMHLRHTNQPNCIPNFMFQRYIGRSRYDRKRKC